MRSRNLCSLFVALILPFALATVANADSYHYKNILIGERASGMAGAYTAVADDPSGIYYNPAGMVYSQGTNISASANAYHNTTKKYSDVIGGNGWERNASSLLPNFFGVVQKVGDGRFGLAYVVPDSVVEDQDQIFHGLVPNPAATPLGATEITDYIINFNNEDNTYLFGAAYAMEINDSISMGLSLFYHHRRVQKVLNQIVYYDTGDTYWQNFYYESEEDGVRPVLGFMWTPMDKLSFGLSIAKTFVTSSDTMRQVTVKPYDASSANTSIATSTEERKYPTVVNMGAAYFASETLLVSADVNYYTSEDDNIDAEKTWLVNFALGTEYYFSPNLAMRAGLYTNMSSAPKIVAGEPSDAEEHVDLYGGSLSFSHFGRGSSLTFGMSYAQGSGDAQITDDPSQVQDADITSWTLYLSNSYGF